MLSRYRKARKSLSSNREVHGNTSIRGFFLGLDSRFFNPFWISRNYRPLKPNKTLCIFAKLTLYFHTNYRCLCVCRAQYLDLKSNFLLCRLFFLSDHNFISNEGNLIIDRKVMLSGIRSLWKKEEKERFYITENLGVDWKQKEAVIIITRSFSIHHIF